MQRTPSVAAFPAIGPARGPGVRVVDTYATSGAAPSPHYDTLLAKF